MKRTIATTLIISLVMCLFMAFPASASEFVYIDGANHGQGVSAFLGGVLAPNGKVILVPFDSANVGVYDPVTDKYTNGALHGQNSGAFMGGVLASNGKIIFVPHRSTNIGVYDPVTNKYTKGATHVVSNNAFAGGVSAPNGKVILIPRGSSYVGIYDPVTDKYTNGAAHNKGAHAFNNGVLLPNGKILLVPRNSLNIGIYDPVNDKYTDGALHNKGADAFNNAVLLPNGKVVLIPRYSANIGIYDPVTNIYSDGAVHGKGQIAFMGGVLAPNGKVVLVPYNSTNIGIYDPATNIYIDGAIHGKGTSAFYAGFLIENKIIFAPTSSSNIGIYIPPVDTSALESLLSQTKSTQNTGYTQSSWNALQSQISAAENLLATTGYTQAQIDSAKNALQSAFDGLVLLPDASDLESLLVESETMQNTGYTQSSWNTLQIQISAVKSLLNSGNYTKSQIDNMLGALQTAINGLVFLPDASFLEQLIADAQTYVDEKYTELSLQILNSKIMQAIILLDNKDYVTAQIDNAIAELVNAINGLVLVNQPEPPIIEPPETKPPIIEVIGDKWYSLSGEQKKYADLTDGIQPEHLEPIKEAVTDNMQVARMYGFWAFIITLLPLITVIVIIGFVRNSSDDYSSIDAPRELGSGGGTPLLGRPRWKSNVSGKNIDID